MKTKLDDDIDFNPAENPSQDDYNKKFNEITGSPDNKAFGDQVEAGSNDGFRYTGDQDRDSLFDAENEGDSTDVGTAEPEKNSLQGAVSKKGDSNWKTNLKSKKTGIAGKINSLSGGKKKLVLAVTGSAGVGAIVMLLLFLIPFASFLSLEQLTTVLKTYRFANFHYSSYRRMSQYTVQESLDTRPITVRGKVSAKLAKYNPVKSMGNLKEDGTMEFVYKDGKSRWTRRPTKTLEKIRINTDEISVPKDGTRNFFKQRKFMKEVDSALAESELLAGKSRYFRTKVANEVFKSREIKLNRWLLKGRKIKTLTDAVRSLYDSVKSEPIKQSLPDVDESAEAFDDGLDEAIDGVDTIDNFDEKIADHTARSIKENRIAGAARKFSLGALFATLYCAGRDYVSNQDEIGKSKALSAQKMALKGESAVAQTKYGDTTAAAIDHEAFMNTGFESSYAYQQAVGVDPTVLAQKEPDLDKTDAPVEDTDSIVRKIFDIILGLVGGVLQYIPNSDQVVDKICRGVNSASGQAALGLLELALTIGAAIVSAGTAAGVEQAAAQSAQAVVRITFREAIKKLSARQIAGIVGKEVFRSVASMTAIQLVIAFSMDKFMGTNSPALDTGEARTAKRDMGMKIYANDMALASGGRQLTGAENAAVQKYSRDTRLAALHKKPLWYRLASLSNPYSPASRFAVTYPKSKASLVQKIRSLAFTSVNPTLALGTAGSKMGAVMIPTNPVFAATNESDEINEYKFPTIGFSVEEQNTMLDDSFWPRENAEIMESTGKSESLHRKFGLCFKMMDPGEVLVTDPNKTDTEEEAARRPRDCKPASLSSSDALRYRLYRMDGGYGSDSEGDRYDYDQGILGEALDLQDVTASVGGEVGDPDDPTDPDIPNPPDGECAPGASNERVVAIGDGSTSIRLCDYGGVIGVNASWSGSMSAMLKAAEADGLNLSGGGFRTAAEQIALRKKNCGSSYYAIYEMPASNCRPPTARPGRSNHERGLAIDFNSCSSRGTACYKWLAANAGRFGVYNLPSESWHWSIDGK